MKILITNTALQVLGGTERVVLQLGRKLRQRGHQVAAFSTRLGHVAEMLAAEAVPVVSCPQALPFVPDLIHGQHHLETMAALLAFPQSPALFYWHGVLPWQERVPLHPRILRYLVLSEQGPGRLAVEKGIPPERCRVLPNIAGLEPLPAPKPPPASLRTAAFFPRAAPAPWLVQTLRGICRERGIAFHVEENWMHGTVADPGAVYAANDLIFGTGRTALEALGAGCAVCTTDHAMLGPLITVHNVARRAGLNFALALWEESLPPERLAAQLAAYHPAHQQAAVDYVRTMLDPDRWIAALEAIYAEVIDEWRTTTPPPPATEMAATSNYLRALAPFLDEMRETRMHDLLSENAGLREMLREAQGPLRERLTGLETALQQERERAATAEAALERRRAQLAIWEEFARATSLHRLLTRRIRHLLRRVDGS